MNAYCPNYSSNVAIFPLSLQGLSNNCKYIIKEKNEQESKQASNSRLCISEYKNPNERKSYPGKGC